MMKRVIGFIVSSLILISSFGLANEVSTVNTYSDYELVRLFNEASKRIDDVVRVPAGLYIVGKDLPAGVYTVLKNSHVDQNTDNDISHVAVFSSMEEYNINPNNLFNDDSHALIACNTLWKGFSYKLTDGMILYVKMGKAGIVKRSKNLFAAFWDPNDEQSPSVYLSSIIASKKTEELPAGSGGNEHTRIIVESSDEWAILKEYAYNNRYGYYCFVVFKHTFPIDQNTTVSFTFYDSNNNIIGNTEDYVGCTGCNYEYIASGHNNSEYDYVVVSFSSSDLNKTTDCMDGISILSARDDLKITVTAENTSKKPISSCKINVLYFDENKNVVDSAFTYLPISVNEMQKGEIITQEIDIYYGTFDSFELYYSACNYGNK